MMEEDKDKTESTRTLRRRLSEESQPKIHSSSRSRIRDITFNDAVPNEPILLSDKTPTGASFSRESRWRSARKEIPGDPDVPPVLPLDPPPPMPAETSPRSKPSEPSSGSRSQRWRSRITDQSKSSSDKCETSDSHPPGLPSESPPPLPHESISQSPRRRSRYEDAATAPVHSTTTPLSRSTSVPTTADGPDEPPSRISRRRPPQIEHASRSLTEDALKALLSQPISIPSHPLPPPVSFDFNAPISPRRKSMDKEMITETPTDSIVGLPAARAVSSSSGPRRQRPAARALQTQKPLDKEPENSLPKTVTEDVPAEKSSSTEDTDPADYIISQFQSLSITNLENKQDSPPKTSKSDSSQMSSSTETESSDLSFKSLSNTALDQPEQKPDKPSDKAPTPILSEAKLISSAKTISEQPSRRSSKTLSTSDVAIVELSQHSPRSLTQPSAKSSTRSVSPRTSRTMSTSDIPLDDEEIDGDYGGTPPRSLSLSGEQLLLHQKQSSKLSHSLDMTYSSSRRHIRGPRGPVATDLDQAARDLDEQRLRAWFKTPSKKDEISPKAKPVPHPEMETDIDDEPGERKFITNIHVAGVSGESTTDSDKSSPKRTTPPKQSSKGDAYKPVNFDDAVKYPRTIPGKLDFSQMEVFEGMF